MKKLSIVVIIIFILLTACKSNNNESSTSTLENKKITTEIIPTTEKERDNSVKENYEEENQTEENPTEINTEATTWQSINTDGSNIIERFSLPNGYERINPKENSFSEYLQHLPLKPDGSKVLYYDGREKTRDVYLAVIDLSLGNRDLQQCADSIMRLRAEYLYANQEYESIQFHFVNGFHAKFSKWMMGYGISVKDNDVSWVSNNNNNQSYESLQKYLDMVYAYAGTLSMEKELIKKDIKTLDIGDVFIKGGSPGHAVIVVDMAEHTETGEKIFMLAQGYMPAQDIQILKGDNDDSPWYHINETKLKTPEWVFEWEDLRSWEE